MRAASIAKVAATVVVVAAAVTATTLWSTGPSNPHERGPEPTTASVEAEAGPFAYDTVKIPKSDEFGSGTIYYPTDRDHGTFGAVAVVPGYMEREAMVGWYGPLLASNGFVAITINAKGTFDLPNTRGDQLLAALKYLVDASPVRDRVDRARLAVIGHSMGGGGALEATQKYPDLKASIPLAPFNLQHGFSNVKTPTLVITGQKDDVAPPPQHGAAHYDSLPAQLPKAYLELAGAGHMDFLSPKVAISKHVLPWLKLFVDNDIRYAKFVCPVPAEPTASVFKGTCPRP